jgi:hypothetical protein
MRALACLLLPALLGAQDPSGIQPPALGLDLRTDLGTDPLAALQLVPPRAWDGLILGVLATPPPRQGRRGTAGATVEVWDFALLESSRGAAFSLYLGFLRDRLNRAWALPPPGHGKIELAEFVFSDPANPQKLDLTKVKSLQDRFNRLPPHGSPVR